MGSSNSSQGQGSGSEEKGKKQDAREFVSLPSAVRWDAEGVASNHHFLELRWSSAQMLATTIAKHNGLEEGGKAVVLGRNPTGAFPYNP